MWGEMMTAAPLQGQVPCYVQWKHQEISQSLPLLGAKTCGDHFADSQSEAKVIKEDSAICGLLKE